MRTYVFVDAENHYLRSIAAAERVLGSPKAAKALASANADSYAPACFPRLIHKHRFGWDEDLQLFWDCMYLCHFGLGDEFSRTVQRAVYVTSCAGDENRAHQIRVDIREIGFEPIVIVEPKNLQKQRVVLRDREGLLDKPKGCDIALVTRMVADAAADLYDCCCLFTSDADFLPAIEAVRRLGKVVIIGGYAADLPKRSPYLFVPDKFIDLEHLLKTEWNSCRDEIKAALESMGEQGPFNES